MKKNEPWFMEPLDFWLGMYAFGIVAMFLLANMLAAVYQGAC